MTDEQVNRLIRWLDTTQELSHKSNNELADLLTNHIWAYIPLGNPQSDLLAEVIERLRKELI